MDENQNPTVILCRPDEVDIARQILDAILGKRTLTRDDFLNGLAERAMRDNIQRAAENAMQQHLAKLAFETMNQPADADEPIIR